MWIVFEGIDGSGKTTLSNRVAGELRSRGVAVAHMREGGQFASRVTQSIRELGRDPANLTLSPRAELLLYLAREVQLVDESVAPALEGTDVVICDRFVHTAEVLAVHGRGLPADEVETLVEWSAHGLEPNLTILIDVDPQVARARRRVAKIVTPDPRPSSRKGLTGVGMQHRLRAGYLELARRDPARWIVVDNTDADLDALTAHLTEIVLATLYAGVPAGQERSRLGELRSPARRARSSGGVTLEDVVPTFLSWIDDCAAREPALAAYFLAGLAGPEVDPHRLALARTAPAVIAWGLRGLGDPVSWTLRHVLSDRAPGPVARSLSGFTVERREADRIRLELAEVVPADVARSLDGLDTPRAWMLRERLWTAAPDAVVASLQHLDTDAAWKLRLRWLYQRGGMAGLAAPAMAAIACESIAGLDGDRAWRWRTECSAAAPVPALDSLTGLDTERAWHWRERHLAHAPKVVMRTLKGLDTPRAWTLREAVAERCKEALDSMNGLDGAAAWRLRDRCADVWPSTVVKTLGCLVASPRGQALLHRQLERHGDNLSLLRHAAAGVLEPAPAPRAATA